MNQIWDRKNVAKLNHDTIFAHQLAAVDGELKSRYPGVDFRGESCNAYIALSVRIESGATIDLRSGIHLAGHTEIGPRAVLIDGH